MKRLAFFGALLIPALAAAAPVRVQSGEHAGFSRLVLNGIGETATGGWTFGRTEDGYALTLDGPPLGFDVLDVFRLMSRNRVSAVWVDPNTGGLNLRIACACHAIPYELGSGILVIDVRDGPAPSGSSFENGLDGLTVKPFAQAQIVRPRSRPTVPSARASFPTLAQQAGDLSFPPAPQVFPLPDDTAQPSPLRDDLLRKLSEGSARGVVTLELPADSAAQPNAPESAFQSQIRVGEDLGMIVLPGGADVARDTMTADGANCPTADQLDLAGWGRPGPVISHLSNVTTGIVGEFDDVDPTALDRAAKYYVWLGFGAEAKALLAAFDAPLDDAPLLIAMADVLDGVGDPASFFAPMAMCDTPAAMWAALSATDLTELPDLQKGAVIRGFSALPDHLRRQLGPDLANAFLTTNDVETARAITEASRRATPLHDTGVALAEAEVNHALGDTAAAEIELGELAEGNDPAAERALILLVDARIAEGKGVAADQIAALDALLHERRGTEIEADLLRALALAQASAGLFDLAFAARPDDFALQAEIWAVLANHGSDSALLQSAVLPDKAPIPDLSKSVAESLARRLLTLGLAGPAARWVPIEGDGGASDGLVVKDANDEAALLTAQIAIAQRDGTTALRHLAGLIGEPADRLRAAAFDLIADQDAVLRQYVALNDIDAARVAARHAQDWKSVAADTDPVWSAAASLLSNPLPDAPNTSDASATRLGPLARSRALLDESEWARATVDKLLAQVTNPAPP